MIASFCFIRLLYILLAFAHFGRSQPSSIPFKGCVSASSLSNPLQQINVSTVYAQQGDYNDGLGRRLKMVILGETGQVIDGASNETQLLATLFSSTTLLTYSIHENSSFFCSTLRPASDLLVDQEDYIYCPLAPGPLAFAVTVPLSHPYQLATLNTRIRVVDSSIPPVELTCLEVATTAIRANKRGPLYGHASIVFWVSVGLTIAYWVVIGSARISAAWDRGIGRGRHLWLRMERAGFMMASAISGEKLSASPALLRFVSPSWRDIIFHTQWCAALAMAAVNWPDFTYPFFSNVAWSTLVYNVSLVQGDNPEQKRWNPLSSPVYEPPAAFANQLDNQQSPLFLDRTAPNTLLMFPDETTPGLSAFAVAVGLRPQDLFGTCLAIFLLIVAGTIIVSSALWALDWLVPSTTGTATAARSMHGTHSPRPMKEISDQSPGAAGSQGTALHRPTSRSAPVRRGWWKYRLGQSSFHGSVLHGNLVRILLLFHFPVTVFSCYQFTLGRPAASTASIVLAVFSFLVFSIIIPALLMFRIVTTRTTKLFEATRTLLSLGPLYSHYNPGSQLFSGLFFASNLALGITLGCGQKSGTAQAIIILIIEVVSALMSSVWLPWGSGARMGALSFLFCVARIVSAVLLVILSPTVAIGDAAGGWVACAILVIQGAVYSIFLLLLISKATEGLVRLAGGVPFDSSRHSADSGLWGALSLAGCCGKHAKRRSSRRHRYQLSSVDREGRHKRISSGPNANYASTGTFPASNGPPSVLRPEQANRPYNEDGDDESGHILGPWQSFPQPEGNPRSEAPVTPSGESEPPKSGFARIGGGRATYSSPYSISNQPSSSVLIHGSRRNVPSSQGTPAEAEAPLSPSAALPPSQTVPPLPAGAMSPSPPKPLTAHARSRSQTAVIEDASTLVFVPSAGPSGTSLGMPPPPIIRVTDDASTDSSPVSPPKKRGWFGLRGGDDSSSDEEPTSPEGDGPKTRWFRRRRRSDGEILPAPVTEGDSEAPRSFQVIRNQPPANLSRKSSEGERKSAGFTVGRPNLPRRPSTADAAPPSSYVGPGASSKSGQGTPRRRSSISSHSSIPPA